jgi:hypothetical protein
MMQMRHTTMKMSVRVFYVNILCYCAFAVEAVFSALYSAGWLVRVGIGARAFVTVDHAVSAWTVCAHLHSAVGKQQQAVFVPRVWLHPDGSVNRPMLRWLCEGVLMNMLVRGGCLCEQTLAASVVPAMSRCALAHLCVHTCPQVGATATARASDAHWMCAT